MYAWKVRIEWKRERQRERERDEWKVLPEVSNCYIFIQYTYNIYAKTRIALLYIPNPFRNGYPSSVVKRKNKSHQFFQHSLFVLLVRWHVFLWIRILFDKKKFGHGKNVALQQSKSAKAITSTPSSSSTNIYMKKSNQNV